MPWYKLELKGGRGHTNQHVKYIWSSFKWSTGERKAQWENWANEFGYERIWDGLVVGVKRLPARVRDEEVTHYLNEIEKASEMLEIILKGNRLKE